MRFGGRQPGGAWCGRGLLLLGSACLVMAALPISAFVPKAERVAAAVADANEAAARTQALRLEIRVGAGGADAIAQGELVTHPTGMARIELRFGNGTVERHLLQGTEHTATRNGRPLKHPRPVLPPLFLLQADSGDTLRAALDAYGILVDAVGLAPCGEHDCYVVGDPSRVPPPIEDGEAGVAPTRTSLPSVAARRDDDLPKIWLDIVTFDLLRIDGEDGIRVRIGPPASFGEVRFPAWLVIEEPERDSVRMDVLRATPVNAPAPAFSEAWLFGSETDSTGDRESESDAAEN
ncbi:MAG: hypothetical protein V3T07_06340 [Myxococcota bacterium]